MSNDTQMKQTDKGKWRWGRITLIVSLALNLLFVGAIAGSMWAMWAGYWSGPRHHGFAGAVHHLMRTLPDDRRTTVRGVLRSHRGEIRPLRREMRKARRAAARVMRRDPFEEAAFRSALGEMRAADTKIREAVGELAVDLAKTLTLEERRELLRALARNRGFGGKRGKGGSARGDKFPKDRDGDEGIDGARDDDAPAQPPAQAAP